MHLPVPMVTLLRLSLAVIMTTNITGAKGKNRVRGVRWWNLAQSAPVSENLLTPSQSLYITPSLQPLKRKQRRLVTKNPGTIVAIATAARMAITECQYQFKHRRWNCPTMDNSHGGSIFGKILRKGCRETAFIYAITSAAVAHSIARACSEGSVYTCSCGHRVASSVPSQSGWDWVWGGFLVSTRTGCRETAFVYAITSAAVAHSIARACSEGSVYTCSCGHRVASPVPSQSGRDWEWGGCSDNAQFGYKFSRDFVDVIERGRDLRYMMNLHNNEAGRMHVTSEMQQECKCHGMSGSCTMKTCWMRLRHFRQIGHHLKDRFDGASRVYQGNSGNSIRDRKSVGAAAQNLLPVNPNHKPPDLFDLVYFENSPDFCEPDSSIDFAGTKGRQCNATSIGVDGCDLMCCDRGYVSEAYTALERCNCTFHWCCKVTCQICQRERTRYLCL